MSPAVFLLEGNPGEGGRDCLLGLSSTGLDVVGNFMAVEDADVDA